MHEFSKSIPSQKHLIYWDDVLKKTGIDSAELVGMTNCHMFPQSIDGLCKEGVTGRWIASEVEEWLQAWRSGLRDDALADRTAEILAARNTELSAMIPDSSSPADVMKWLFPELSSEIDRKFAFINRKLEPDSIHDVFIDSDGFDISASFFRAGRYWVLEVCFNGIYSYFLFEGSK